jgi:hypothetical protein
VSVATDGMAGVCKPFRAFKKSDTRVPDSSICMKLAAVTPWPFSFTSAMTYSRILRSDSAGVRCDPVQTCLACVEARLLAKISPDASETLAQGV